VNCASVTRSGLEMGGSDFSLGSLPMTTSTPRRKAWGGRKDAIPVHRNRKGFSKERIFHVFAFDEVVPFLASTEMRSVRALQRGFGLDDRNAIRSVATASFPPGYTQRYL
jgi:hypothetical protein